MLKLPWPARAARHALPGLLAWCLWWLGGALQAQSPPALQPPPAPEKLHFKILNDLTDPPRTGRETAQIVCATCHLFPEPDLVPRRAWTNQILPQMSYRLGVAQVDYEKTREGSLLKASGAYPNHALISDADWEKIWNFYHDNAPPAPLPQGPRAEIAVGLKFFKTEVPKYRQPTPLTTMVKISPATRRIFAGDERAQVMAVLDKDGQLIETVKIGNVPISLVESARGSYLTSIGNFQPTEQRKAELSFFAGRDFSSRKVILEKLPRAAHTEFADFNGDGQQDFAICLFGNYKGRFSWFENLGGADYREHVLLEKAGSIHCLAHDFNGDGFPDLALLMAQETESLFIWFNDGKGNFKPELICQKHPLFGHNYFELADFNGDARMDFLVVNGDNGEYESETKRYHGLRIYLNRGGTRYAEAFFYPLNGAIKAIARDFDGDGDLDIAAISFFPDYLKSPRESFVYLENLGGLKFSASTFRECVTGRWIALDAGDLDGDGDLDLVLGSYIKGPTSVPGFLMDLWEKQGPSVQILRNKLR